MHIPDGYLGPVTAGAGWAIMVPIWAVASRVVKKSLKAKQVPLLAMGAAFSFVVMMFDIPLPGGSTGHALGGVLLAILLGPWAACVAMSVVLVIQALFLGDGGVTALGANCFNMAFLHPFSGYLVYRLLSGNAPEDSRRRVAAAAIAGYAGLNAAALATGVEIGIQPLLHHAADGRALYSPYGLGATLPVMMAGHLLVFGFLEALVTALVFRFLQTSPLNLPRENGK